MRVTLAHKRLRADESLVDGAEPPTTQACDATASGTRMAPQEAQQRNDHLREHIRGWDLGRDPMFSAESQSIDQPADLNDPHAARAPLPKARTHSRNSLPPVARKSRTVAAALPAQPDWCVPVPAPYAAQVRQVLVEANARPLSAEAIAGALNLAADSVGVAIEWLRNTDETIRITSSFRGFVLRHAHNAALDIRPAEPMTPCSVNTQRRRINDGPAPPPGLYVAGPVRLDLRSDGSHSLQVNGTYLHRDVLVARVMAMFIFCHDQPLSYEQLKPIANVRSDETLRSYIVDFCSLGLKLEKTRPKCHQLSTRHGETPVSISFYPQPETSLAPGPDDFLSMRPA